MLKWFIITPEWGKYPRLEVRQVGAGPFYDRRSATIGEVPEEITYVTSIANEARRLEILKHMVDATLREQHILETGEQIAWRVAADWGIAVIGKLNDGRSISATLISQREKEATQGPWTKWHAPDNEPRPHLNIEYRAALQL